MSISISTPDGAKDKPKRFFKPRKKGSTENVGIISPISSETEGGEKGKQFRKISVGSANRDISQSDMRSEIQVIPDPNNFLGTMSQALQYFETKKETTTKDILHSKNTFGGGAKKDPADSEGSMISETDNEEGSTTFDKSEYLKLKQDNQKLKKDYDEINEKYLKVRIDHKKMSNDNALLLTRREESNSRKTNAENNIAVLENKLKDSEMRLASYVDLITNEREEKEAVIKSFRRMIEQLNIKNALKDIFDDSTIAIIAPPIKDIPPPPLFPIKKTTRTNSKKLTKVVGANTNMDEETMAYIHKLEQENQYREHKIEQINIEMKSFNRRKHAKALLSRQNSLLKAQKDDSFSSNYEGKIISSTLKTNSRPQTANKTSTFNMGGGITGNIRNLKAAGSNVKVTKRPNETNIQFKDSRANNRK